MGQHAAEALLCQAYEEKEWCEKLLKWLNSEGIHSLTPETLQGQYQMVRKRLTQAENDITIYTARLIRG